MQTKLARFTKQVVTLAQKTVVGNPDPAVQKGNGGCADWVSISIHSLREYLHQPYRRLLDILYEMPRVCVSTDPPDSRGIRIHFVNRGRK